MSIPDRGNAIKIVGTIAFDIAVQINIKQSSVDNQPISIVEQTYTVSWWVGLISHTTDWR